MSFIVCCLHGASLMVQMVKNLLAMQETQVQFLDWEDPLEYEMAAHSRENPMDRGAWWAIKFVKSQTVRHN